MTRRKTLNSSFKEFHQIFFFPFLLFFFFSRTLMKIPKELSFNIEVHLKEKESATCIAQKDPAF